MPFLFANKIRDCVRDRNIFQEFQDNLNGRIPPEELPNYTVSGITTNGTFFLFSMVFKPKSKQEDNLSFLTLIDKYAQCTDEHARKILKGELEAACGKQVDGLALLMWDKTDRGTTWPYGFVSGSRIKVSDVELDDDGMFNSTSDDSQKRLYNPYIFILKNEKSYTEESIQKYLAPRDNSNREIDPNINAVKRLSFSFQFEKNMDLYLKNMAMQIKNEQLKAKIQAVYAALQKLKYKDEDIKYRCTCLTIQLLSSDLGPERERLLAEYNMLANQLYGSKFPWVMSLGLAMIALGAACAIFSPLPLTIIMLGAVPIAITGVIAATCGGFSFFSTEAVSKREQANTLFNLKDSMANLELEDEDRLSILQETEAPNWRL
ncbi:hypothetical protein Lnau_0971 [Legionella nautarum]|uniref:Uncharacterized protein n=1 Tax=Legionella nautarum TaxID=45070 RepID=A0A0W0WUH1_9GAMM|nr:hypothetical protein [Legionella nautarum]KTD35987.1 hypothetical protein Lnau_0971 [Legionella nautarum]